MKGAGLVFAAFLLSASCARVESNIRVERGPLLRAFERPLILEGGLKGRVQVDGSQLKLSIVGYDVCRTQKVEEFAQITTTETRSAAAGPTLSTGIANVLASAVLFGVSFAVSGSADTTIIDASGRYGPSTKQYLQGASVVTLGIGVPALVVGLVAQASTRDEVETRRAEEITSQLDKPCQERPMRGPLAFVSATGASVPLQMSEDEVLVDASAMPLVPQSIRFADRPVELTAQGQALFERWASGIVSAPTL